MHLICFDAWLLKILIYLTINNFLMSQHLVSFNILPFQPILSKIFLSTDGFLQK